jgi:hypothetical protein
MNNKGLSDEGGVKRYAVGGKQKICFLLNGALVYYSHTALGPHHSVLFNKLFGG